MIKSTMGQVYWTIVILVVTNCLCITAFAKPSFDCTKASTPVEHLICSDEQLSLLDGEMGIVYNIIRENTFGTDVEAFIQKQRDWLEFRVNECSIPVSGDISFSTALAVRACTVRLYKDKITEFTPAPSFDCGDATVPIEYLLCADPDLRALDGEMGLLYFYEFDKREGDAQDSWKNDQISWLKRRDSSCDIPDGGDITVEFALAAHDCLTRIYRARISSFLADSTVSGVPNRIVGVPPPDENVLKTANKVIGCFNAAKGNITIQGMHDCAGVWVTPRALILCGAQTQCPILADTAYGRSVLDAYLAQAGLNRASPLSLNQSLYPTDLVDPTTVASCGTTSSGLEALLTCSLVNKAAQKFSTVSPCVTANSDTERAQCLAQLSGSGLTKSLVSCVGDQKASAGQLLTCMGQEKLSNQAAAAVSCVKNANTQAEAQACISKMLPDDQVQLATCLSANTDAAARTTCLEGQFPDVARAHRLANCISQSATSGSDAEIQCVAGELGGGTAKVASCLSASDDKDSAIDCLLSGNPKLMTARAAYSCVSNTEDAATAVANCADALIPGLDDQTRQALSCVAKSSGDTDQLAACAATAVLPKEVARLVSCAADSSGATSFAICAAAPSVNEEWRIAAECAVESGGQPYVWAGCTATQLTVRELTKCFEGQDCFGPNNTIVKFYTDAFNDLTKGPGENNEVVKALKGLDDGIQSIGKAAEQVRDTIEQHTRITIDSGTPQNICKNLTFGLGGC